MKKKSILLLIIVLLVISNIFFILYPFNEKEDEIILDPVETRLPNEKIDEYLRKAINEGDIKAYDEFSDYCTLHIQFDKLFFYSFLMANKYDDHKAFFDLYILLSVKMYKNGIEMFSNDEKTQNYAKYFLLKSHELGYNGTENHIENVFGKEKKIPNSSYYLYKIAGDTIGNNQ